MGVPWIVSLRILWDWASPGLEISLLWTFGTFSQSEKLKQKGTYAIDLRFSGKSKKTISYPPPIKSYCRGFCSFDFCTLFIFQLEFLSFLWNRRHMRKIRWSDSSLGINREAKSSSFRLAVCKSEKWQKYLCIYHWQISWTSWTS